MEQWQTGAVRLGVAGRATSLNWFSQGPLGKMCEVRPDEEDTAPEGLGGHLLAQADGAVQRARWGDHLHRQPGAVGGEAARREMIQPHAV